MDAHSFDEHLGKNGTGGIVPTKENCKLVVEDVASLAVKTRTEIDLNDGVIRRTWKMMGFAFSRTYDLDRHVAVQIKEESSIFEGYNITLLCVYLTSRGSKIRIAWADDYNGACRIQSQITDFLKESAVKCTANMNTTVSGA
jgi:hypothetical protein